MTNPNDTFKLPTDTPREIISPEGLDERVVHEETFRITLTQGGKYRVYHVGNSGKAIPMGIHEALEPAKKDMGMGMTIVGALEVDAKRTLDAIFDILKKK